MKNYIKVPFNEKDKVKECGGRWDNDAKSWYIPDDADKEKFKKWESHDPSTSVQINNSPKVYLNVPFADKDEVKLAGGRWDMEKKQWYYFQDKDAAPFKKWLGSQPTNVKKENTKQESHNSLDDIDDILNLED